MTGGQVPRRSGTIDAHHRLWVRARHPQLWADPVAVDAGLDSVDVAPLAESAGVTGTVVVRSIASDAETADLLDLAADSTLIRGVVGGVDLTADHLADRIDRLGVS
ncbi:hypothetical protein ABGB07_23685 [Micromonosporaceae bacterium B7E4]